jgi:hypothetical protein
MADDAHFHGRVSAAAALFLCNNRLASGDFISAEEPINHKGLLRS